MSKLPGSIIESQTITLGRQFHDVRGKIEGEPMFADMMRLCTFDGRSQSVRFQTERIHPPALDGRNSVLLLFSNPHPLSVLTGMFLSEPRSRVFWRRLFDCQDLEPPAALAHAIDHWDDRSPAVLTQHLLTGQHGGKLLLHFDCLEALPTNQYADLSKLFRGKSSRELRQHQLQEPGLERLELASEVADISHWVVFSVQAFRKVVGDRSVGKYAPKRICAAIEEHISSGDTEKFWRSLDDLHQVVQIGGREISVFLGLIARAKNWRTSNGLRYFTLMMDRIFAQVLRNG